MTETRMKLVSWHQRPRMNRLASILYPGLADDRAKKDMDYYAQQEGKQSPQVAKLASDKAYRDQAAGRPTKPEERRIHPRWWETK